jgi:hypothetical protein
MREFGPVRFLLGNSREEAEAAKPYMGIARTQLGITKNLMNLGGLQQYARVITLPDGTVIRCQSVMGQDFVAITPPGSPSRKPTSEPILRTETPIEKPKKRTRKLSSTAYQWFQLPDGPPKNGHQAVWDNTNKRMLVWGGYDRPGMDIPATPELLDDDMDIVWAARSGGTIRYASIIDNYFSALIDGVMIDFYAGASWYTYELGAFGPYPGTSIGHGPLTAADLVAQLYIGDTSADKADAIRYDMPRAPVSSFLIDMLPSTALWKFEFTAGVPWSASPGGATDGAWTQLANISYNDWQAMVTAAGSVSISINNAWAPERGDALNQAIERNGEFYDAATSDYYPGYTSDDYWELYFGGTITGADTSMSRQLWMYGPIVTVTEHEEDDPT